MVKHKERAHALLSASGASRWINCTPSPRIEEKFTQDDSVYAAEGTLAHELGDLGLKMLSGAISKKKYKSDHAKNIKSDLYSSEMDTEVEKYTSYVMEEYNAAKNRTSDAVLMIEEKVDLTEYIEEGFGTCDADIIADGTMEVIDLKYGKGVAVSAEKNEQLMLYGLGALRANEFLYNIVDVKLTIVQPRLNSISSWFISAKDLRAWGDSIVKPKAELAYKGEGLQKAGTWCRWCKAKARCATLASNSTKVAQHEFKDPHLLTDDQLMQVYKLMPQISDWVNAVGAYILKEALSGKKWAGYKLVEGRSNRKWSDELKIIETLKDSKFPEDKFLNTKLKGIGDIEKLVGKDKFPTLLGDLVIKPQGKPTLVDNSDKRPEMATAQQDFK